MTGLLRAVCTITFEHVTTSAIGQRWCHTHIYRRCSLWLVADMKTHKGDGRIPMLSAFGKRLLRHKQRLHRWVEHKKWCGIESAYVKPMFTLILRISIPSNWESSDVALVRISEKVKQSDNFVYAITKYVSQSLPLKLSSLISNH